MKDMEKTLVLIVTICMFLFMIFGMLFSETKKKLNTALEYHQEIVAPKHSPGDIIEYGSRAYRKNAYILERKCVVFGDVITYRYKVMVAGDSKKELVFEWDIQTSQNIIQTDKN